MKATLRRFLMVQGLLLWQGGFLFYVAVVVPIGTNELGSFTQGRVTREVTRTLNMIGFAVLFLLALCQHGERTKHNAPRAYLRLVGSWFVLAALQLFLFYWHGRVESTIDFAHGTIADYPLFYLRHRVYLWAITVQWLLGLAYTWQLLDGWRRPETA